MDILALLTLITLVLWLGFALAAWVDKHNPRGRIDWLEREWNWIGPVLAAVTLVWMVWMLAHLPGVP